MKRSSIELIAFDKHQNLQYQGACKITVNRILSILLVQPKNEGYKLVEASFKWNFAMDKNIMFVFAENDSADFALIFKYDNQCKKVYDFVCSKRTQNVVVTKEMFFTRFWNPLCTKLAEKDTTSFKLKQVIRYWIGKNNNEEKEKYVQFLKKNNIYDFIYSSTVETTKAGIDLTLDNGIDTADRDYDRTNNHRKRKHSEVTNIQSSNSGDVARNQCKKNNYTKILTSRFKIVNILIRFEKYRRLLIFVENEKCFELSWGKKRHLYFCNECNSITAIIGKNENGDECVKMEDKEHLCTPIPYDPKKYIELNVIKKPNYEVLENCSKATGKLLIVFGQKDRTQCWEFRMIRNGFFCRRCETRAKLWNENTVDEYVELRDDIHKCSMKPYDLKNYYEFNDFLLSPNFEIQKVVENGTEKEILIIFNKDDRNLCYVYSFERHHFRCRGCINKRKKVWAKLFRNSDDEEYLILSKTAHVCELRSYAKLPKNENILHKPDFELMEETSNGCKKIFIFEPNDRSLCQIFSCEGQFDDKYYCIQCRNQNQINAKNKKKYIKEARVKLCEAENGEHFLRLNNLKHTCKPKKYEPQKYEKKEFQKCYDYFFFRHISFPDTIKVAIPEDKNLCFIHNYQKAKAGFICCKCKIKGKTVVVKLEEDTNGKEYFNIDNRKHVCEPTKISTIHGPNFVVLQRKNLNFEVKKVNIPETDEVKITSENFELRPSKHGILDGTMFIFDSNDRNLGYRYRFRPAFNSYICHKSPRCNVSARLQINKNGEKFVIPGPNNDHKCTLIKYEVFNPKKTIIKSNDFIRISQKDMAERLIVFTTSARDECYEYFFHINIFCCHGCNIKKKRVSAKFCKDPNGSECLEISKQNHSCIPRKYIKEKYEPKQHSYNFELQPSFNGVPNKKLIVFTSEEKEFAYEYRWKRSNCFRCWFCSLENKYLTIKLCENENGQKYIEFGPQEHVCQPVKYVKSKIISKDSFVFHDGQNGEKNKYLIVFTSDKKDFAYTYHMSVPNSYRCNPCHTRKINATAKVIEDENGIKSVKLSQQEHVCKPKKYDPNVYTTPKIIAYDDVIFHDGKNGEKDKFLIIFTTEENDFAYQYSLHTSGLYYCIPCFNNKNHVSAKITDNDENGIKTIKLGEKVHECQPQKYNPKNYQI